jgi:hypothetical protein
VEDRSARAPQKPIVPTTLSPKRHEDSGMKWSSGKALSMIVISGFWGVGSSSSPSIVKVILKDYHG